MMVVSFPLLVATTGGPRSGLKSHHLLNTKLSWFPSLPVVLVKRLYLGEQQRKLPERSGIATTPA